MRFPNWTLEQLRERLRLNGLRGIASSPELRQEIADRLAAAALEQQDPRTDAELKDEVRRLRAELLRRQQARAAARYFAHGTRDGAAS